MNEKADELNDEVDAVISYFSFICKFVSNDDIISIT